MMDQERTKEYQELKRLLELKKQALKNNQAFTFDGVDYAGCCRMCGCWVRVVDADYTFNVDGAGTMRLDIHHKLCL